MDYNQIYQLLNDTATQCYGANAVATLDLEDMISLRDNVIGTDVEGFLNVLVDRIGKTIIRTLDYVSEFPDFIMNDFEFGAILQKLDVQPFMAVEANYTKVGDVSFQPSLYRISKPTVRQGFFKGSQAWEIDVTIPDTMYRTAFESAAAMDAFLTAIYKSLSESLAIQIDNDIRLSILGFIGEKLNANNGVIDILALYNDIATTPITTAEEAKHDKDFLKFLGKTMADYIRYMSRPSVLYNIGGAVRATSRDNMHVMVLTDIANSMRYYLENDMYKDISVLPAYHEISWWQGSGTSGPEFDDVSKIDIEIPSDGTAVTQDGIIAVFADRQAIGTGLYDRWSAVDRSNRDRMSNITEGLTVQRFIDVSENGLVWVLKDQTP